MTSGASETKNVTLLRTGTIDVSAIDVDGASGKRDVWVEASPFSNAERGANEYQYMYSSNGCITGAGGTCTITVGASSSGTTYYINAYVPYYLKDTESIMNPEEVSVTVAAGGNASADPLYFRQPDGTITVTIVEGTANSSRNLGASISKAIVNADESAASPIANATVDCFSPSGATFEKTTNENGEATCPCITTDSWKVVAYNLVSNNLWLSEATSATCAAEGGTAELTISNVATVPEGKSITITDASTQSLTIELSDGFSVFFPIGSLSNEAEQVTCNVDVAVTPFTANKRPATFYGYMVNCQDSDGSSIVQLSSNATFRVPVNQTQVENLGLTVLDIEATYFDDSRGSYSDIGSTLDSSSDFVTFQVNHLTTYSIVGNGNLSSITGEDTGDDGSDVTEATASSSGGCGCVVGSQNASDEAVAMALMLVVLFGGLYAGKKCLQRIKK